MEIAREVDVSDVQVLYFERGERVPKKEVLKRLAEVYDVPYIGLRKMFFSDWFAEDSEDKRILLEWASEQ